jgi:selenocysteine-specific elongation factor
MKSVVIGTAGHIDHGKSALVRALTGTDPDRLKEEKARGITIDLGFAHLDAGDVSLAFVDVPGHERFVKNMLAGAGGIDIVALVIAADESVMPQTREHFQICRMLRVPCGVIVLTKADLADAETLELATLEARELVAGSFLADAPVIPVSSVTGVGMDRLRDALLVLARNVRVRDAGGPARLPIDRVFSVKGFGTVVTGTLVSGEIREGEELDLLPSGRRVKVRGLQVHGKDAASASAGRRVAANLGGVEMADVERGNTLAARGTFEPTRRVDVTLDLLEDARALRHGARVRFHHGTSELLGRVAVAGARSGSGSPAEIAPGGAAYARIRLERPAVLTRGDRFIVRAYSPSVTVGGGVVLDPQPPRGAIRTAAGLRRFVTIDVERTDPDTAIAAFIDERGAQGLAREALVGRLGLTARAADAASERLVRGGRATVVGELLVSQRVLADLATRLLAAVDAHHASEPLSGGLPREEARERLFGRSAPAVFERVLADAAAQGKIVARDRLSRSGHQVSLSPDEARARTALERVYRDADLMPPDLAAAARMAGVDPGVADRVAKLLLRDRTLVKLETLLFHADALARVKADVRALKTSGSAARVDVSAFKERYGITRKFAIPLLEYLDRERVTRRVGELRVIL